MLIDGVARRALKSWLPPKMELAKWLQANVRSPGCFGDPRPARELWPYQVELANCFTDPAYERISFVKATRLGFTTLTIGTIGAFAVNDPSPALYILPTSDDCRDFVTSELDPVFAASPTLRDALKPDPGEADRNIMLSRRFKGGFLKIIPARSPRNLRRHTARIVLLVIAGSTPTTLESSPILKRYAESDRRIYECPCPHCGTFVEIAWKDITGKI